MAVIIIVCVIYIGYNGEKKKDKSNNNQTNGKVLNVRNNKIQRKKI